MQRPLQSPHPPAFLDELLTVNNNDTDSPDNDENAECEVSSEVANLIKKFIAQHGGRICHEELGKFLAQNPSFDEAMVLQVISESEEIFIQDPQLCTSVTCEGGAPVPAELVEASPSPNSPSGPPSSDEGPDDARCGPTPEQQPFVPAATPVLPDFLSEMVEAQQRSLEFAKRSVELCAATAALEETKAQPIRDRETRELHKLHLQAYVETFNGFSEKQTEWRREDQARAERAYLNNPRWPYLATVGEPSFLGVPSGPPPKAFDFTHTIRRMVSEPNFMHFLDNNQTMMRTLPTMNLEGVSKMLKQTPKQDQAKSVWLKCWRGRFLQCRVMEPGEVDGHLTALDLSREFVLVCVYSAQKLCKNPGILVVVADVLHLPVDVVVTLIRSEDAQMLFRMDQSMHLDPKIPKPRNPNSWHRNVLKFVAESREHHEEPSVSRFREQCQRYEGKRITGKFMDQLRSHVPGLVLAICSIERAPS